jgi:uncharacterized protein (TIGR02147 family)
LIQNVLRSAYVGEISPAVIEQVALQKKLNERFAEIRAKNPAYTLRSFAKKLGLNSGALSGILSGKRRVSAKLAQKLIEKLSLDPQERHEILNLFPERKRHIRDFEQKQTQNQYLQLSADQFHVISEWQHFAILSLMKTKDFRPDSQWIAARLGQPPKTIALALKKLVRLGLISETSKGEFLRGAPRYRTTDDVSSPALRRAHAQNLVLAQASLDRDPVEARDFTAITLAIDPSKLGAAKELIRKFQDELAELVECGEQTEVYKLCVQMFPLTQTGDKK